MTSRRLAYGFGVASLCGAAWAVGCSLDETGISPSDAAIDNSADVLGDVAACSQCVAELSAGWRLALLGDAGTCPANFAQQGVVLAAEAGASACTCACDPPVGACTSGAAVFNYGTSCASSQPFAVTGACQSLGGTTSALGNYGINPPPAGPCTPRGVPDAAAVAVKAGILCESNAQCDITTCNGSPPTGWVACIEQAGDLPCPSGKFTNKFSVGFDAGLSCTGCACSADGCEGTLTYFDNTVCGTAVMTFGPTCFFQDGGTVGSYKWSGGIVDGGCAPTAAPTPVVTITGTRTLCCAP